MPHRVGALVERPAFYPYLSATENLLVLATAAGLSASDARARTCELLDLVGLGTEMDRQVGHYSTGMRQRLGIAGAMIARPDLRILDDPANGLDPQTIVDVRQLVARLKAAGLTVLLSSHLLSEVERVCDRVAILDRGGSWSSARRAIC